MDNENELLCTIALTQIKGVGPGTARSLCEAAGGAVQVMEHRNSLKDIVPDASPHLLELMTGADWAMERAKREMEQMQSKKIDCITFTDPRYPQRLLECPDAPIVLYHCGNANLNAKHIISMVGTRKCTDYGRDICRNFVAELKELFPDALIVSGLAYGIDIHSHKAAIANGMPTIGVLAHGLDRIYPYANRQTAVEMTKHGGLLTEYVMGTTPEKGNFVQRNRIVAGISDVTIVVESADKGGSLITANIAHSYQREVLAFPGRVYDEMSKGCNRIIQNEMAHAIRSAEDFCNIMGWAPETPQHSPVQQELFVELTSEEQKITDCLGTADSKPVSAIVAETGLTFSRVSVMMFNLENKGIVQLTGGARYRLLRRNL